MIVFASISGTRFAAKKVQHMFWDLAYLVTFHSEIRCTWTVFFGLENGRKKPTPKYRVIVLTRVQTRSTLPLSFGVRRRFFRFWFISQLLRNTMCNINYNRTLEINK